MYVCTYFSTYILMYMYTRCVCVCFWHQFYMTSLIRSTFTQLLAPPSYLYVYYTHTRIHIETYNHKICFNAVELELFTSNCYCFAVCFSVSLFDIFYVLHSLSSCSSHQPFKLLCGKIQHSLLLLLFYYEILLRFCYNVFAA